MNKIELKNHKVSGPEYIIQWNLKYSCFVGKREYHKVDIPFPFTKNDSSALPCCISYL